MDKNPFEILGIAKEILYKLNNEQIRALFKTNYRTLQTFFHPDKQDGNSEKSTELNWAVQELEDEKKFLLYKKQYLGEKKKKTSQLEQELERYRFIEAQYYRYLVQYLSDCAKFSSGFTIANIKNLILEMTDTLLSSQEENYLRTLNPSQDNIFTPHFNLSCKSDGTLVRQYTRIVKKGTKNTEKKVNTKEYGNKMLIGVLPFQSMVAALNIDCNTSILNLVLQAQLIDSINENLPALPGKIGKPAIYMKNTKMSLAGFTLIMPHLTVDLVREGYLFSINKAVDKIFFEYEGKISKIREK